MNGAKIQPPVASERPRLLNAALAHLHDGRFAESAALAQQLVAEYPRDMEALMVLGLALGGLGELDRAVLLLTRVARERPNYAHPCADLADLLRRQDRVADAYAQFRAARELDGNDLRLAYAHAEFLLETGRAAEALGELERALQLRPAFPSARRLWAIALAESGRLDDAVLHFRRTVAAEPLNHEARANLAVALGNAGEFEAALAAFNAALFHAPDDPMLHVLRAMALLKSGRLLEGFAEYEWRVRQPGQPKPLPPQRLLPNLADIGDLAGRSVLLTHDEGFGDTLQFLRYAPLLAERGARVLAWVPPELARLVRTVPELAAVLSDDTPIPDPDFHCPFISLPRVFGTTVATIPADIPYIRPDPALVESWGQRLPAHPGPRIGLVWSGSPRPANRMANLIDRRRSMALATLAPLAAVPDALFVSLQLGARAAELNNPPPGMRLCDPMGEVADFADTAGIVANLDAVVSVDTSVVHLAAAMGKPVLMLDRHDNCWRWLTGRSDTPWYPTLRIFRQARPGDWTQPVANVAAALAETAAKRD